MKPVNKLLKIIKNILFPENMKCVLCSEEIVGNTHHCVCEKCYKQLPFISKTKCYKCGEEIHSQSKYCLSCKSKLPKFNRAFALFNYEGSIARMVKELKYDNKLYLKDTLSNFIVDCYLENDLCADLVIPVPLHEKRYRERGYNQADVLCENLKEKLNLNVANNIVVRNRHTITQTNLTKDERIENIKNAFTVTDKSKVKNKTVLVVDDVYTTGSTLNEISHVLKGAGAKCVYCITLAHTKNEKALEN